MCTAITLQDKAGNHYFARNMDFAVDTYTRPIVIPRNTPTLDNKYAFIGTGYAGTADMKVKEDGSFPTEFVSMSDGVNEKGLAADLQYFEGAVFAPEPVDGFTNLGSDEFMTWALSQHATVAELVEGMKKVRMYTHVNPVLGLLPLHYMFTDRTGRSIVVEPESETGELVAKENKVGVMTNAPRLEWHEMNLNFYGGRFHKDIDQPTKVGEFTTSYVSESTGTHGMPGGMDSPDRYIRTAYNRSHAQESVTEDEEFTLSTISHILGAAALPYGPTVDSEFKKPEYTLYKGIMDLDRLKYTYMPYLSITPMQFTMTEEMMSAAEPTRLVPLA